MTGRRLLGGVSSFFFSLVLIVVILLSSIQYNAFNLNFFEKEFSKLSIPQSIGISESELMDVTKGLLAYIQGEREDLNMTATIKGKQRQVFNEKEMIHMVDVQKLYLTAHSVRSMGIGVLVGLFLLIWALVGKRAARFLAGGYLAGAGCILILLGIIGYMISRDFLWFWTIFHEVVFTNDLWLLNPETDILIQIVPEQFFLDLVVRILIFTVVPLILLIVAAAWILLKTKNTKAKLKK